MANFISAFHRFIDYDTRESFGGLMRFSNVADYVNGDTCARLCAENDRVTSLGLVRPDDAIMSRVVHMKWGPIAEIATVNDVNFVHEDSGHA